MSSISFFDISKKLILPRYQISALTITLCILSMIMYKPLTSFNTNDPKPPLHPYTPSKRATVPEIIVPVKVGLYISNFPVFDVINNNFTADMKIWFEFDPVLVSIDTIEKYSFDRGTIESKEKPDIKIVGDKVLFSNNIRLKFTTSFNYKLFPLNDHRLSIVLKNEYVDPEELRFVTEKGYFSVNPHANTSDWSIADHFAEVGYFLSVLDENDPEKRVSFPGAVFSLNLHKMGIRKIFIILLPMTILLFISLVTFSIDPQTLGRSILALSTGTLTGLIAYRFVIEKLVPDVGYFTFTDHLFNLFLMAIFIIFLVNVFAVNRGKNDETVVILKGITFIFIQLVVIFSFYFLIRL